MKVNRFTWLIAAACISLSISAPRPATAATIPLIVQHTPATGNFGTIQAAINFAVTNLQSPIHASDQYIVQVQADNTPYTEPFTPVSNVWIVGDSTAGTFLGGSGTQITLSGVQNVTIRNFTFRTVGISVTNGSSATIENNIFNLGATGTAINLQDSPSTSIINNTFVNNATAISTNSDANITNNIFFGNTTAILTQITPSRLSYNYFFANNNNGVLTANLGIGSIPNIQTPTSTDPLFVDRSARDFHLQSGSPAANAGNPSYKNSFNQSFDMGAYGGPNSDNTLATVTGLTSTLSSTTPPTIQLNWDATSNPGVTAYRVYYNTSVPVNQNSPFAPVTVQFPTTTATLSNLPGPAAVPAAPTLNAPVSLNQALRLSWSSVAAATGYRIYYSTTQFDATSLPTTPPPIDVGAVTTYTIPNLTNGTTYFVAVATLAQTQIFAAVTAVIDNALAADPGTANESPLSTVTSQVIGPTQVSDISGTTLSGSPEAIVAVPNVKGEGCFIATAAFGFYSAPQVQVLRDFRDRYLLTNAPGRAFVAWYYHYGPVGAHFINVHPWLKPPVRLALLPLVVGSFLLIHTLPLAKIAIIVLLVVVSVLLFLRNQRKMLVHSGGTR